MHVLINHLTRMRKPYVCVAGLTEFGSHIRPVLEGRQLDRGLIRSRGGPFSLGAVVDPGPTRRRPSPPEVEDVVFSPQQAKLVKMLDGSEFWQRIWRVAKSSLNEIIGDDLIRLSGSAAAVARSRGKASLGLLRVAGAALYSRKPRGKPEMRCAFSDPVLGELSLKVTDIRLWESDHSTPAYSRIEEIQGTLEDCVLAVGLTRFYEVPDRYPGFGHWLQVNNLFPEGDPLWSRE